MGEPIAPPDITQSPVEVPQPQSTAEVQIVPEANQPVDLLIIFGQGPVKPLILDGELDKDPTGKMRAE